jgi:glycosyltransferase involved in cell wall biosynthesis
MHAMKITVILCTYNRCQSLARALESVGVSQMPQHVRWEVLVVDNNSSDDTALVVRNCQDRFPGKFRYVFESKAGKSHALNRGIQETDADVLAFMDDDVEVRHDWLHILTKVFGDGSYAGSGGRILPEAGFRAPEWLKTSDRYALAPLAVFDLGDQPGELKEPPFGTNMAFRREAFLRFGNFRCDLGPQPGSEIRSEDTEFGMRVLRGGERLWYEPEAVVYHSIPKQRVNQSYFLQWWHGKGRADVREGMLTGEEQLRMLGVPLVIVRRLAVWSLRSYLSFSSSRRFDSKAKVWWLAGVVKESYWRYRTKRDEDASRPQGVR